MAGKTRISQYLKAKGSNQKEAAMVIGVTPSTFSLKARGFTEQEKDKLAEYYGMDKAERESVF